MDEVDASMFAAPIPGAGPPASPEEYKNRVDSWTKFLSDPGIQEQINRMGMAQGLVTFGTRLMQNAGSGQPAMAQLGNAAEAGMWAYGDTRGQYLQNALNIAKAQAEEDDQWGRRALQGQQQAETRRHQSEMERLTARGQDTQLKVASLYASRAGGAGGAGGYQALNALQDNARQMSGAEPKEPDPKDYQNFDGTLNKPAFDQAMDMYKVRAYEWGQRFAANMRSLGATGRYGEYEKATKKAEPQIGVGKPQSIAEVPKAFAPAGSKTEGSLASTFEIPASGSMQVKGKTPPVPPTQPTSILPGQAMGMGLQQLEAQVDPLTMFGLKIQAEWMAGPNVNQVPIIYEQLLRERLIANNPAATAPPTPSPWFNYPGGVNQPYK